jgi:hypothetical protein
MNIDPHEGPSKVFVSAEGFVSWSKGRGDGRNGIDSHQKIKNNAQMSAETATI